MTGREFTYEMCLTQNLTHALSFSGPQFCHIDRDTLNRPWGECRQSSTHSSTRRNRDMNAAVEVQFTPEQATKTQRGSRGIALLFL